MGKGKLRKTNRAVFNGFIRKAFPPKISILIGMPNYDGITQFTHVCLDRTIEYFGMRGIPIERYGPYGNAHIDNARNNIVEYFLKGKHTHLIWIDDDMVWDPPAIEVMLNHDVPVCSAIVTRRHPPYAPTIYTITDEGDNKLTTRRIPFGVYPLDKTFYFPNSGIGTAFMLVKREILEIMPPPYFASPPTGHGTIRGEDFYFCMRMAAMGYKILYDPTLPVYHMGVCPYGIEDHANYMAVMKENPDICQFTNLSAATAEQFKRSFAGLDRSLIKSLAPVAAQRYEELLKSVESRSVMESCQSQENGDQTKQPTKISTDVPK